MSMSTEPLASQLRPVTLDAFVGQEHLVGKGKPIRLAIEKKELLSFILWGPPGCGKTTLARIYAKGVGADFFELSAVDAGKEDIRKIIGSDLKINSTFAQALRHAPRILFIDEIHRFTKAQQDFLLPFVERGDITFIGATTENPSFEVISPLLSRCRVFVLEPLSDIDMAAIFKQSKVAIPAAAQDWLIRMAEGDARQALTVIETAQKLYGKITVATLEEALQSKTLRYDKKGEEHYNVISAFIKSMRASDEQAAMYYLARMVQAGEDPLFIARRMVVFASEDIGLAQPTALVVANAVFRACETIGYPECSINLAHGVSYLAHAKKDRSSYDLLRSSEILVREYGALPVPKKLRNAPTKLMKKLDYGKGYDMYNESQESFMPDKLKDETERRDS